MGAGGIPLDLEFNRFLNCIPTSIVKNLLENAASTRFDHTKYGLAPAHDILAGHPTISDELPGMYDYLHFKLSMKTF